VDNEAPVADLDPLPGVLGGTQARLSGTAAGGGIGQVEVQADGGAWLAVAPPYLDDGSGGVAWTYHWYLPAGEGVEHALRVRATDLAGNTGPASEPVGVTVDTVRPGSEISYPEAGAVLESRQVLVWGVASDGWGVAQVEVSLDGGTSWEPALLGQEARDLLASLGVPDVPLGDDVWAAMLEAHAYNLAIRSRATDLAGNVEPVGVPVRVTIQHQTYWLPLVRRQ
jgi:hypothetical protein